VVGVFRRELRPADTKGPALFHAFEDEVLIADNHNSAGDN
jgi:hypothetical protein